MITKEQLFDVHFDTYNKAFNDYIEIIKETRFLNNSEILVDDRTYLSVIVIRMNPIYQTNDMNRNNDFLVLHENGDDGVTKYIYNCTADPKIRKGGIANLMEQAYFGNIRNHRSIPGRPAICQDNCPLWVKRYFKTESAAKSWETWNGQKILNDESNSYFYYEDHGNFGIHIHNPAGAFNSSLGCVILAQEDSYINTFRPLLKRCLSKKINKIPVIVVSEDFIIPYLNQ